MPRSIKMSGLPSDGRKPGDGQGQLFILLGATMQVQRVPHRVPLFSRNSSVHTAPGPDNAPFLFISFSLPLSLSIRFDSSWDPARRKGSVSWTRRRRKKAVPKNFTPLAES